MDARQTGSESQTGTELEQCPTLRITDLGCQDPINIEFCLLPEVWLDWRILHLPHGYSAISLTLRHTPGRRRRHFLPASVSIS